MVYPVAYLGFHFGGVQNFSGKVGVFAWRKAPCHAFARGVWGHAPPENFFKNSAIWCVLESILLKFCQKIILKLVIFYIKITDNVLLRTIFGGIGFTL